MELSKGARRVIGFSTFFVMLFLFTMTIMTFMVTADASNRVKRAEYERDSVNQVYFDHLKNEH